MKTTLILSFLTVVVGCFIVIAFNGKKSSLGPSKSKYKYTLHYPSGRIDSLYRFEPTSECDSYIIQHDGGTEIIPKGNFTVKTVDECQDSKN
jgi:hypothetical protein